ncbi:GerMN domain-containing protein [Anaerocolumna xylanovorans]|uniref:Sporulation and spore germination n=1 Tax=Anaerocolumna xylanovorans DSM 12503 TaxID=1121345 RepID=A0A1M7XZ14_9FIRM|nr:GerMN domain-containing protein [Anaerocolumna xylanovorans]SHO44387.1 Sporulation and spore germination [Anaerocolumna xylanovorans DSM 12503]
MKKIMIVALLLFQMAILMSCREKAEEKDNTLPQDNISETPAVTTDKIVDTSDSQEEEGNKANVLDYFPYRENKQYFYEGEGNEYASFWSYTDYQDKDSGRIQLRTDNGGTETVQVIEGNSSSIAIIVSKEENYYRDNLLKINSVEEPEVLLMGPLEKGTEWTLADGRKRYISDMEKEISVPLGKFTAIEVTTEENGGEMKEYYAKDIGLIKREYNSDGLAVTSSLKEIKETPLEQNLTVYYPNGDEKVQKEEKTLKFYTNDITRLKMQELLREKHEASQGLISLKTNLNSLYKGSDDIVYADFSKELITDMNAGAGFEQLILQAIADTLGGYYDAKEICLTVEQKPYESGHILLKKGETLKVSQ